MQSVIILHKGEKTRVSVPEKSTIAQALEKAGINPETVIVRKGREIIPETEFVGKRKEIEALNIVSGG